MWREIARQLPSEDTLYLADQAHVPYGSRSLTEVRGFSEEITRFLLGKGAKIIVVACNTASAAALHHLRHAFPQTPFVGMEPAVKPAVERTHADGVGVIATQATFQGELFSSLAERYAGEVKVLTQICPGLVEAVEAGELETAGTDAILRTCLAPLIDAGIDQLVLGCTHYPFLRPAIERVVGRGVNVIDPGPAVARQTGHVLVQRGLETSGETPGDHGFYTTGDAKSLRRMIQVLMPECGEQTEVRPARWKGNSLEG